MRWGGGIDVEVVAKTLNADAAEDAEDVTLVFVEFYIKC
jgi:hypothetical protein